SAAHSIEDIQKLIKVLHQAETLL
ncbi:MAG: hypothetical protein RL063_503, partial [Pseudomonadota bacterium]